MILDKKIKFALDFIKNNTDFKPRLALILGSGLGEFGSKISATSIIQASEIPNYPISSVQGHAGKLIFGYLNKDLSKRMPILVFQGRVHFYETGNIDNVIFPVLLAKYLGVKSLIVTNAAGGINNRFVSGDLMLIKDILNLTSMRIPADRKRDNLDGLRNSVYFDNMMQNHVINCALKLNVPLQQGSYAWLKGPSYETPAEIQYLKKIGVDAVGMSTVPEIFTANALGIKTVGISLISNLAAGISPGKLSHKEVTETANKVKIQFSGLMENLILSISY